MAPATAQCASDACSASASALLKRTETARQALASKDFALYYQYIFLAITLALALRHLTLTLLHHRKLSLIAQANHAAKCQFEADGRVLELRRPEQAASRRAKLSNVMYHPIPSRWVGHSTPLELLIILATVGINVAFCLAVAVDVKGKQSIYLNSAREVSLRAGYMSMANLPPMMSLMGRNSLFSLLTGIEYQHARYAHKLLGMVCSFQALFHVIGLTILTARWGTAASVTALYNRAIGQTGIVILVGVLCSVLFSRRIIRQYYYEFFLVSHVAGAILILVGLVKHVPELTPWVIASSSLWAFERAARIARTFTTPRSLTLRPATVEAKIQLVNGALLLNVPFAGTWKAGQHAYISFYDSSLLKAPQLMVQSHPFSIANYPMEGSKYPYALETEMRFVMRIREGITRELADRLERTTHHEAGITVAVEGPYGTSTDTEPFVEVLLVAGGSGITHCMSILSAAIAKAGHITASTRRIHLIWTLQGVDQSSWITQELFEQVQRAHSVGIELKLDLFVSKGPLYSTAPASGSVSRRSSSSSQMSIESRESFESVDRLLQGLPSTAAKDKLKRSSHWGTPEKRESLIRGGHSLYRTGSDLDLLLEHRETAHQTAIISGRPKMGDFVPEFVRGAQGASLVVVCGPAGLAADVRREVARLETEYPVELESASFEC